MLPPTVSAAPPRIFYSKAARVFSKQRYGQLSLLLRFQMGNCSKKGASPSRRTSGQFLRHYSTKSHSKVVLEPSPEPARTYKQAVALLGKLKSNQEVVDLISNKNVDMNKLAIPEMLSWLQKAGYTPKDFNSLRVIHVAGTKGKGSVCAMIDSMANQYLLSQTQAQSQDMSLSEIQSSFDGEAARNKLGRVGVYTSPHLVSVRERIRLDGQPISEYLFALYFFDIWDRFTASARAAGHPNPEGAESKPGYFRFLTIMTLHAFLRQNVQTVVMECGIGGEYDSTNILLKEAITTSVITSLGIDHVGMLGNTLGTIAWHKGGIMRQGVPCFTVQQPEEAMSVLRDRARDCGTDVTVVKRRQELSNGKLKLNLEGDYQKDNASLAIAALSCHFQSLGLEAIPENHGNAAWPLEIRKGLASVSWPGRCQVSPEKNIEWLIDGAHTEASLAEVALWFAKKRNTTNGRPGILIFNSQLRDAPRLAMKLHKYLREATGVDDGLFEAAFFPTNVAFKNDLPNPPPDLAVQRETALAWEMAQQGAETKPFDTIEAAMAEAKELAEQCYPQKLQVLVTGSLHLVGGLLKVMWRDRAGREEKDII